MRPGGTKPLPPPPPDAIDQADIREAETRGRERVDVEDSAGDYTGWLRRRKPK